MSDGHDEASVEEAMDERHDTDEVADEMHDFLNELHDGGKIKDLDGMRTRVQKGTYNTGVKGVLHDYKTAKTGMQERLDEQEREKMGQLGGMHQYDVVKDDEEDWDALLADDDDVLSDLRAQRLRELQKMGQVERELHVNSTMQNGARSYGKVFRLTADDFVDGVDKEPPNVLVIVLLHQPHIIAAMKINEILPLLAKKYPRVKFCSARSTEVKADFDELGLPAIVVYKSGDVVESFVRVHEDLPNSFDFDDVDAFLIEKGVVSPRDAVVDFDM